MIYILLVVYYIFSRNTLFPTLISWDFHLLFFTGAVQEKLHSWMSRTQSFFNDVTLPLVKTGQSGKSDPRNALDAQDVEDIFMAEQTIDSRTPNGILSLAAIVSIEQFSR